MDLPQGWRRAGPFRANAGFRQALARARDEAANRHHRMIRPAHMLVGVLHGADARVVAVLEDLGISVEALAKQAAIDAGRPIPPHDGGPDLPYTQRGVAVLHGAALIAEQLHHDWLGAVHLLVALSHESWGVAPRVLHRFGAEADVIRHAVTRIPIRLSPPSMPEAPILLPIRATP